MDSSDIEALESRLGVKFRDISVLRRALSHKQLLKGDQPNNERMEFVGDSVLHWVVARDLIRSFPDAQPYELDQKRQRMSDRDALYAIGYDLDLEAYLQISNFPVRNRRIIVEDTVEAIIGAVYEHLGVQAAEDLAERLVLARKENFLKRKDNPKNIINNRAAQESAGKVVYNTQGSHGDWISSVSIGNRHYGTGRGHDKKTAERNAADVALVKLGWSDQ